MIYQVLAIKLLHVETHYHLCIEVFFGRVEALDIIDRLSTWKSTFVKQKKKRQSLQIDLEGGMKETTDNLMKLNKLLEYKELFVIVTLQCSKLLYTFIHQAFASTG